MLDKISISKDAFSSGQIGSKLWLCEKLEPIITDQVSNIWMYGGWYATTALLLLSRGRCQVNQIRSFDLDPSCQEIADALLENWVWRDWKFKAFTKDCDELDPIDGPFGLKPSVVINTSTEHFESDAWFQRIRSGTLCVLQGNDMTHDDHVSSFSTVEDFKERYRLSDIKYHGSMTFTYPSWSFTRWMTIGYKP